MEWFGVGFFWPFLGHFGAILGQGWATLGHFVAILKVLEVFADFDEIGLVWYGLKQVWIGLEGIIVGFGVFLGV